MSDKKIIPGALTVEQIQKQKEEALRAAEAGAKEETEPSVVAAKATSGGRIASQNILYVGNVAKSINDETLKQIFQVGGKVSSCKIIFDKASEDVNYAFIEFFEKRDASIAYSNLNGQNIEGHEIKVNWAYQNTASSTQEDTFNIFVGDLSVDVDDKILSATFNELPGFVSAHVMWDMVTGFSRGYGFVSFRTKEEADVALASKQGFVLNGRALRLNHAAKKQQQQQQHPNHHNHHNQHPHHNNYNNNQYNNNNNQYNNQQNNNNGNRPRQPNPLPPHALIPPPVDPRVVEDVIRSEPHGITTAFVGNIPPALTQEQLIMLLQNFGNIRDLKYFVEKRHCFVKFETREQAALCIVALGSGFQIRNRALRTGWGKEYQKPNNQQHQQQQQQQQQPQEGEQQPQEVAQEQQQAPQEVAQEQQQQAPQEPVAEQQE